MIGINELRVGNFVAVTAYGYSNGQQVRMRVSKKIEGIRQFSGQEAFIYLDNDKVSHLNIRPVLLSREIILSCGFEQVGLYDNVYHRDDFRIYLDRENGRRMLQYSKDGHSLEMEVEALHQLQNLYYTLSGWELDVDL